MDEVIDMALAIGMCVTGAHVDISHAFRNLGMHPSSIKYIGFTLNGKYYINTSLPFGASIKLLYFRKSSYFGPMDCFK